MDRKMLSVRVAKTDIEATEKRAKTEELERSELIRRMLNYAIRNMPKGWKP